jgi:hypothetical protein
MTAKSVFSGARRANGTIALVRNSTGEEAEQQFSPQSLGAMACGQRAKKISRAKFPESKAARRRSRLRRGFIPFAISPRSLLAIASLLAGFALSPARAVSPAPDGGYPGQNTAEGDNALSKLTTGGSNTATGFDALMSNTTGNANTATGENALRSNTNGGANTATGSEALLHNTTGGFNTATGLNALFSNTIGSFNTATGLNALFKHNRQLEYGHR